MKNVRILLVLFFLLLGLQQSVSAQKFWRRSEVGFLLGASSYMGDLNDMALFKDPSFAGGLLYRYTINQRLVARANILYGNIQGGNPDAIERRNLSFESYLFEFSGQMEFNFLPYYTGTHFWWSPYIFAGAGFCTFNPKATYEGESYSLRTLGTEGQTDDDYYSLVQFSIPMGIGFKFSVSKYISLGIEYGVRATFTDYLDDVSTTYADPDILRENHVYDGMADISIALADRTGELSKYSGESNEPGSNRGNSAITDWYSFFGVTMTVSLRSFFPQTCKNDRAPDYYETSKRSRKRHPNL